MVTTLVLPEIFLGANYIMSSSFTDLQTFWECPRRLGFRKLGYKPVASPVAVTTGQFVHEGLQAFFIGGALDSDWATQAVARARNEATLRIDRVTDKEMHSKFIRSTNEASDRALKLLSHYFDSYANDYRCPIPEVELKHANVICHVDLLAEFKDELAVVDFKTTKSPDIRWYDFSGQCDVYSYVLVEQKNLIGFIVYDIISEEGLFRHIRKPNLEKGKRLFRQISTLGNYTPKMLLGEPQCQWGCPQCDYFYPCWLWETGEPKGAVEYLTKNYVYTDLTQEVVRNETH